MTKKLSVRKEKRELTILRRPRIAEKRFCAFCSAEVRWLVPEEAMVLAGISLREIFRLVEKQKIHFVENANGFLLVCAKSLAEKTENFR